MLNYANLAIFLFICVGAVLHHRRDLHVKFMLTAFALDILLLLVVEFTDNAIATAYRSATEGGDGRVITLIHVAFAVGALLMWFVQIVVGRKIYKQGRSELMPRHAAGARLFLVLRLGNVVTAFML